MERTDCIFMGKFNGKMPCIIGKYLGNGINPEYCACSGDFSFCEKDGLEVSRALLNYWDSPERISHQSLREQATIENGKRL